MHPFKSLTEPNEEISDDVCCLAGKDMPNRLTMTSNFEETRMKSFPPVNNVPSDLCSAAC
jgi:hypothetical protein